MIWAELTETMIDTARILQQIKIDQVCHILMDSPHILLGLNGDSSEGQIILPPHAQTRIVI